MNVLRVIQIATFGWRSAVVPKERLALIAQVETWCREEREIALEQQRNAGDGGFPGVHRARDREAL